MPEWLKALLMAQGSLGFADTLQQLVGLQPNYQQLPNSSRGPNAQHAGKFFADQQGNPTIGLTQFLQQAYGRNHQGNKLGDFILGHEFGHAAGSGYGNTELTQQLESVFPNQSSNEKESESLADIFSQSVQFLRNHSTDTTKLSPQQALITNILLQQPIYAQHPINQVRALQQIIAQQKPQGN